MTVFPLKYDGSNTLQDMSTSDLERLTYYLQVAYAVQLDGGGKGSVSVGSGATSIGSASDTSATQQTNQTARGINDGIIQGFPSHPGIGVETDTTYSYQQDRTTPSAVSSTNFNLRGMLFYDSANDELEPFSTEAQLADVIIDQAITNMRTGNEVGTYRVATSEPSSGGAGTYSDKGTFFTDTTFSAGTTTTKLWLKMALDSVPGSDVFPVGLDSDGGGTVTGNIHQRLIVNTGSLIQDVLLPALTRKMSSGLHYSVATSSSGVARGSFTDTKQTGTTNTTSLAGGFYKSISTPSGTASTVTTHHFNLLA